MISRLIRLAAAGLLLLAGCGNALAMNHPDSLRILQRRDLPYRFGLLREISGEDFHLADLRQAGERLIVACGGPARCDDLHPIMVHDTEFSDFSIRWRVRFAPNGGGLAAHGDLDGDAGDELLLWEATDEGLSLRAVKLAHWTEALREEAVFRIDPARMPPELRSPEAVCHGEGVVVPDLDLAVVACRRRNLQGPSGLLFLTREGVRDYIATAAPPTDLIPFSVPADDPAAQPDLRRHLLFMATNAADLGNVTADEDDLRSFWVVRRLDGSCVLHRPAGGAYSTAATFPLRAADAPGYLIGASLRSDSGRRDQLRVFDSAGELQHVIQCHAHLTGTLVVDRDRDGEDEILAGFHDGSLILFDNQLRERRRWLCEGRVVPLQSRDLTGDGRSEVALLVDGHLALLDAEMKPLARLALPLGPTRRFFSNADLSWLLPEGRGRMLVPAGADDACVVELVNRPPAIRAGALTHWTPWLLLIPLAVSLTALYRRRGGGETKTPDDAPCERTADASRYWSRLYPAIREFRHSRAFRKNVERLLLHLNNYGETDNPVFKERFREVVSFFVEYPLPALRRLQDLMSGESWAAPENERFHLACAKCEAFAGKVLNDEPLTIVEAGEFAAALQLCRDTVKRFKDDVQGHLSSPLSDMLVAWLPGGGGPDHHNLDLTFTFSDVRFSDHLVMIEDDFHALVTAMLRFHERRLPGGKRGAVHLHFAKRGHTLTLRSSDSVEPTRPVAESDPQIAAVLAKYRLTELKSDGSGLEVTLDLDDTTTMSSAKGAELCTRRP